MDENTLCRICLENGASLPIFESNDDESNDIQYKFTLCLKEKIEDVEGYPRYICHKCNDILDATCSFINKYKDTCKILENGLDILKNESEESENVDSFNYVEQSEEEVELDNIKYEYVHDGDPPSDENEDLKPIKLKIKIKKENLSKVSKRPRRSTVKVNNKQITNKIASSILEGEFSWNGESWCFNSAKTKQLIKENPLNLIPKPDSRKRIKIKIPKKKTPKSKEKKLCDLCGEVFKTADSLTVHKKNTHFRKSIKCEHCTRVFVSNYYLSRHMKRKHNEDKKFICTICGRGFAFKGELGSHHKKVHDKIQPKKEFKCSFCDKIYKCNKSVQVHERSAHTGLRPAVCTVCDSSFYHEDYLKEHMRLHTGETPFKCPICGRGYAQRCNMKSHLRIHRRSEIDDDTLSKLRPNYLRLLKP